MLSLQILLALRSRPRDSELNFSRHYIQSVVLWNRNIDPTEPMAVSFLVSKRHLEGNTGQALGRAYLLI